MKKYYVVYGGFANTYKLFYTENAEDEKALPEEAKRITRKEALKMIAEENMRRKIAEESGRRKDDPSFSGYADNAIYPAADRDGGWLDFQNSRNHKLINGIWERKNKEDI